ncbi:MAG: IS66 family insertion sequence element accessory protein TnpB [Limosilactobacillus mucosae]
MLVNWTQPKHVFIVCGKTDLRKGIDGLAAVVAENYDLDLFDDSLFLFCGTRNDRFKGLYWDGERFILLYKRFENGGLRWPRHRNDAVQLSHRQIKLLLEGISPLLSGSNPHQMGIYIDFSLLIF